MAEGQKTSHGRVAFALVCGLAMCCAVMYVTADGDETIHYEHIIPKYQHSKMSGATDVGTTVGLREANTATSTATGKEMKVESWDVKKVKTIWTDDTPAKGSVRLVDYFKKVEAEIASEVASRKENIKQIRTKMATNRAINLKARQKMKTMLLARMAVNAKTAKDALEEQMRQTAIHFHEVAVAENQRASMDRKRFQATRKIMRKNKAEARHALHMATLAQQRALSTLDAATNAKIRKTNAHIAANAAQISENARVARKNLDHAMGKFDKLMFHTRADAAAGRSKLVATAASMDKKFRTDVANNVRKATAAAGHEFSLIRAQMIKDRHDADMALASSVTKLKAALNAHAVTANEHFQKSVEDIAAAKEEAAKRVKQAEQMFKMQILRTSEVVAEQVAKLDQRQQTLSGVVTSNKLEQAKINNHVNAELKRINKVGQEREDALNQGNDDLSKLMRANRADAKKKMKDMESEFTAKLNAIKKKAKADRKYNEGRLAKATAGLSDTMKKNMEAQAAVNKELSAATKQMAQDAKANLRDARTDFTKRLGALTTTVKKNDEVANKKIAKLTGIVTADASKSREGRRLLKLQSEANHKELTGAIRAAVNKGEKRALAIEASAKKMNKKTLDEVNLKISTEIGTLTKKIHADIEELSFATKAARAQMKGEIVNALRAEAKILKDNLGATVKWANKEIVSLETKLDEEEALGAKGRGALKEQIALDKKAAMTSIEDAMTAQARSLVALKAETDISIKKTNTDVAAYGKAIEANAAFVAKTMKANRDTLVSKLEAAKKATEVQLKAADTASLARERKALTAVEDGIKAATAAADKKFGEAYKQMGVNREHAARALEAATIKLNDSLAKQAALQSVQFQQTVDDLAKAKAEARDQVVAARKEFTMGLADVTTQVKSSETKILGEIQVVATMLVDNKAEQARVNTRMNAEIGRVIKLADKYSSENSRARGKIGKIMNENKRYAAQQLAQLAKTSRAAIVQLEDKQEADRRDIAEDLKEATAELFEKMASDATKQNKAVAKMSAEVVMQQASTADALKKAKAEFQTKQNVLTNTIVANHRSFERGLQKVTKVAHDWDKAGKEDRALIRQERAAMNTQLNKEIANAIQRGEARAKEVLDRSSSSIDKWKQAATVEIGERVERMADAVFQTLNTDRKKIANNYLAVKGYSGGAKNDILDYVQKGQGSLLSVGDFLKSVAMISSLKTKNAEGPSAGAGEIKTPFTNGHIPDVKGMNDVNGLTNEFMSVYNAVRARWPQGLGKYLLVKLADSMAKGGILMVGKKNGNAGKWVYVNGKALGLSNKMDQFAQFGCRINHYQRFLAGLSKRLPAVKHVAAPLSVAPPEWQGN